MTILDAVIILAYILGMLLFSIYLGKSNQTQEDYFIGGRSMPFLPVACSIAASTISANGMVGGPGGAYINGFSFFMLQFGIPLVLVLACNYMVPFMYNLKITSCYEYVEMRFGKISHILACFGYLFTAVALLSGFVYIPSLIIQQMTGWSLLLIVPLIVLAVIFYTMAGGIKAVIWTDAAQMVIMWAGMLSILIIPFAKGGLSFSQVMDTAQSAGLLNALDFSPDPALENGFWVALLGGGALWLQYFATDQTQVQRMLSAKSVGSLKRSIVSSGLIMNVMYFVFILSGAILYSFYQGQSFESANQVMITFILENIPIGLLGLIIAAIFAAAMSSIDSVLNSMTAVFVMDIYQKYIRKGQKETPLRVTIGFTGVFGVVVILFVLMGFNGTTASVLSTVGAYAGYVAGSLLSVFLLGLFTRRANDIGTALGFVAGLLATWAMSGTNLNWLWYYLVGTAVSFVTGCVVSCLTGGCKTEIAHMTIQGQRENLLAQGRSEENGVSILPGKMDQYGWILLVFFAVQFVVLLFFTKS